MKATLEQSPRREPGNPRYLSMVVGNIPNASSLDEAKDWLDKHCRSCGIDPPSPSDVYVKGSYSNLIFVKCQTESHRDRLIQSIRDVSKQQHESNQGEPASSMMTSVQSRVPCMP